MSDKLNEVIDRRIKRKPDPISEELDAEEEDLTREARKLRLEAIVVKRRKEIQGIAGEEKSAIQGGASTPPAGAQLLMALIAQGLDPEKANAYIKGLDQEALTRIQMVNTQNPNSMLSYWMIGNMLGKEGTSVKDVVEITKTILDAAKGQGAGGSDMLTKLVTETIPKMQTDLTASKDAAYQTQIQMLQKQIEDIKPMEPTEYVRKVQDAAAALGLKAGVESEEVAKLRLDLDKWKYDQTRQKDETVAVLETVKGIIDGKAGDVLTEVGRVAAQRLGASGKPGEAPGQQTPQTLMLQCLRCGGTFYTVSGAKMAKCPHCGTNLQIKMPTPPEKPKQEVQETPRVPVPEAERGGELTPVWSGPPPEQ